MAEQRLAFDGGVYEALETSVLPNGIARASQNWVPERTGGLRARPSWSKGSVTGLAATRRCKGLGLFQRSTDPAPIQRSAQASGTYGVAAVSGICSWRRPTTKGNALALVIATDEDTAAATTTITPPAGYVLAVQSSSAATAAAVSIYVFPNAPSQLGDQVFTIVTAAGTHGYRAWLVEIGNVAVIAPTGAFKTSITAATTSVTDSLTPTQEGAYILAVAASEATNTPTLASGTTGWTKLDSGAAATNMPAAYLTGRTTRTIAANSLTVASSAASDLAIGMLEFRGWYAPGSVVQTAKTALSASALLADAVDVTWDHPTVAGSAILLIVAATASAAPTIDPLTVTAAGYTQAAAADRDNAMAQVWYKLNAASESGTKSFTLTFSAAVSHSYTVWLVEVFGITTAAALDKTATATAAAINTVSATTAATTQAWEFAVSVAGANDTAAGITGLAPSSPAAEVEESNLAGTNVHAFAVWTTGATGAQTGAWTATVAAVVEVWATITATFKTVRTSLASQVQLWLGAHDDNVDEYEVWSIDQSGLVAGTWSQIDAAASTDRAAAVAFSLGLGAVWYTARSLDGIRRYDGNFAQRVAGSPAGARCVAVHANRVFSSGPRPGVLYYSELADGQTWDSDGAGEIDDLGDDGEDIEDITPAFDGLVIGKRNSLYFLSGRGTGEFRVNRLLAGGCAPGRTLIATPYGVLVVGREKVWLFDGSEVRPISKPIEASYGMTGNFMSTSFIDDHIDICDEGSGTVFTFDLDSGVWRTETLQTGHGPAVLYNYGERQLYGPKSSTVASLVNFRDWPEPARAKDFDTLTETFHFRTPDWWLAPPNRQVTVEHLTFKVRQRGGSAATTPITFTPYYDGVVGEPQSIPLRGGTMPKVFEERVDLGETANSFGFALDQVLASGEAGVCDIEEVWAEYELTEAR